jgi:hypothetical protein
MNRSRLERLTSQGDSPVDKVDMPLFKE